MCFTGNFRLWCCPESSQGCSGYEDARVRACVCVDCDDVPTKIRPISTANPVTDASTTFKGSTSDIVTDWAGFITSLGSANTAAGTSLQGENLSSFANQIGYQSLTPSEQIKTLAASSGGVNRRAILSDHRRQNTTRLFSCFTSLNLDSDASYGCSSSSDQRICTTGIALLSIARIARALDQYGIDVILPSNVSSTTTESHFIYCPSRLAHRHRTPPLPLYTWKIEFRLDKEHFGVSERTQSTAICHIIPH